MPLSEVKIYNDGSHYIGIPKENFSHKKSRAKTKPPKSPKDEQSPETSKDKFEKAYAESQELPKRERKQYISEQLKDAFSDEKKRKEFVEQNLDRKRNNLIKRRIRLWRKVNLQTWSYFVTLTYSDEKHSEESFKKKLMNTLKHLVARKGWKYIGVWERGGDTKRLHFHAIVYIPDDGMIGELVEVKDYSTKQHKMQKTLQNIHFQKHFGRNDFEPIYAPINLSQSVLYMLKYIEKSGEKLIYGGKLPTYFVSDIIDDDILCGFGVDDRKILLFDNFLCVNDGEVLGMVCPEVIEQMPKSN